MQKINTKINLIINYLIKNKRGNTKEFIVEHLKIVNKEF